MRRRRSTLFISISIGALLLTSGVCRGNDELIEPSWESVTRRIPAGQREQVDKWVEAQMQQERELFTTIPGYALPVLQKGFKYYQLQSEYKNAEKLLLEIIDVQSEHSGNESLASADVYYQAGWFYQNLARYSKALDYFNEAYQLVEWLEEANSERLGNILNAKGVVNGNLGNHLSAEKHYREALKIREIIGGADSKDVATTLNNLATLYWSTEQFGLAEKLFYRAYAIRKKQLGDKNYSTLTTLNNIALLHRSMGDYARARMQLEKVLTMRREVHGEDHAFTLKTTHLLGLLYADLDNDSAAEALLRQVAAKRKEVIGNVHPDTARSLFHLACFYDKRGRYEEALGLHLEAMEIRQQVQT